MSKITPLPDVPKLTPQALKAVESSRSIPLPVEYRQFLLENNGGFPSPDCVKFTEGGRATASDVFCFLAFGAPEAGANIEWHLDTFEGRLPKDTLPFARDSCGNLWLIALSGRNAGAVYFWDHGSFATFDETDLAHWPRVSDSFAEFRAAMTNDPGKPDRSGIPSRYAMVKQAVASMSQRDAGFRPQANPGFVWHFDCNDQGQLSLQYVPYQMHAGVTHTDGYSRLLSIQGLIKSGPTRMPG